jgi:hypothetical protein
MAKIQSYVWYAGYGSNLSEQRFLCYIEGGRPLYGTRFHNGCTDKSPPVHEAPITIHHSLYFALPAGIRKTENWGDGGVAFISPHQDQETSTLSRMWKITRAQYEEVKDQEGATWYNHEIKLGEEDGIPIYTITNKTILRNILEPSETYLKTIALGLKETYRFDEEKTTNYLIEKKGIKGKMTREDILEVLLSR